MWAASSRKRVEAAVAIRHQILTANIRISRHMSEQSQEHTTQWLQSTYRTQRDPDGRLVIRGASPIGPILGCAVPVAFGALVTLAFRAAGASALLILFALVVIAVLAYNGSRIWIVGPGSIQASHALGRVRFRASHAHAANGVVLRRELWQKDLGSTDTVYVAVELPRRMKVLSVHNWVGRESRVASGGGGSLARSGPVVLTAPSPLRPWANETLMPAVSEAVSELATILQEQLNVSLVYECERVVGSKPRGR